MTILNYRNEITEKIPCFNYYYFYFYHYQLLLTPMKFHQIIQLISDIRNKIKSETI